MHDGGRGSSSVQHEQLEEYERGGDDSTVGKEPERADANGTSTLPSISTAEKAQDVEKGPTVSIASLELEYVRRLTSASVPKTSLFLCRSILNPTTHGTPSISRGAGNGSSPS